MAATQPIAAARTTLESLVTRYRREAGRGGDNLELEIRFKPDARGFAKIHKAVAAGGGGVLTQVVSVIKDVRTAERGEGSHRYLRAAQVREMYFEAGRRTGERYLRKAQIIQPLRVAADALPYLVALSSEQPDGRTFVSDQSVMIRLKARASYGLDLPSADPAVLHRWRIDLTVARQLQGSDSAQLKATVSQMFATRPPMSADNLCAVLQGDAYSYEVEVEYVGPPEARDAVRPADVTAAAEAILSLAAPARQDEAALAATLRLAAQYVAPRRGGELSLKRMLPAAKSITRADYRDIYPPTGMYLTAKADGLRALAIGHAGRGAIAAATVHSYSAGPPAGPAAGDTILDGEYVTDAAGVATFYAFDAIAVAGANLTAEPFGARLARMDEGVEILAQLGVPVRAKRFAHLAGAQPADLEREIRAVLEGDHPYPTDGLIFIEDGRSYADTASLKWKPREHTTIDMLARRAPAKALGAPPYADRPGHALHFLFVGSHGAAIRGPLCPGYDDLFGPRRGGGAPIQFAPSGTPLAYLYQHPDDSPHGPVDGKIVELRCAGGCAAAGGGAALVDWELVRVRTDRARDLEAGQYFGNNIRTADLTWLNYLDPFPAEELWGGPGGDYFLRGKSAAYKAQTAVISYVKTLRIETLGHVRWVVDIGAGKGQDLDRYLRAQVQNLVALDRDRAALSELVRRKYGDSGRRPMRGPTTVHVLAADAGAPYGATLERLATLGLEAGAADALVCNLAVHYFLADLAAMRNFVELAANVVRPGGQVVLTVLDGGAVHAALAAAGTAEGACWDIYEGAAPAAVKKYSIRRMYGSDVLEPAGQKIGVLLPFSDGQYYEEYLVNAQQLVAEFAARGFALLASARVAARIPDFAARHRELAATLTAGDRAWLGLYGELVFRRDL
jgi:SAM-dependent methyltransferase